MVIRQNWNAYMAAFHCTTHRDKISRVKIIDSYGLLIDEKCSVKMVYYDELLDGPIMINVNESLVFIDEFAKLGNKHLSCNEYADILLNIICKKAGLNYISDLKFININQYIDDFIDRKKYEKELQYIADYLKC